MGPRLVLGTAQIGQRYGVANTAGRPDESVVADILDTARQRGISHLDTARGYGESEFEIGRTAPPGPPFVITKIAPLGPGGNGAKTLESWEKSVSTLAGKGADVTDLLLHRSDDLGRNDVWDTLRRIRDKAGLARIGVSVQTPTELISALRQIDLGHLQMPFNVLDHRWLGADVLDALGARPDVVVVARSVYLQGVLLSEQGSTRFSALLESRLAAVDRLVDATDSHSRAEFCVRYALAHPAVDAVVIGAETTDQVIENARIAALPTLTPEQFYEAADTIPAGSLDLVDPSRW